MRYDNVQTQQAYRADAKHGCIARPYIYGAVLFITVTHMRQVTLKVKYRVPEGTELTKLTKKSAITHIYIGKPTKEMRAQAGNNTRIQINDKYVDIPAVVDFVTEERRRMSPEDAK